MKIIVVIPTYNRKESVIKLLTCLHLQHLSSDILLSAIVVIDGSTDNTLEEIKKQFPTINYILGNGNWWITKCLNEGIRVALKQNPDYILTLNDDLIIPLNYISSLHRAAIQYPNSIIGSVSLTIEQPHRIFFSGIRSTNFNTYSSKPYLKFMEVVSQKDLKGIYFSSWVPTRGMLIPVQVMSLLHSFDEKFPQYGSDTDFCYKGAKFGIKTYVSYDSIVFSDWKKTGPGSPFIRQSLKTYLINVFFNKHSSRYIGNNIRILWKYFNKFMFLPLLLKINLAKFISYYKNQKIDE